MSQYPTAGDVTGHGWCRVMGDLMGWAVGQLMTATATVTYTALLFSGFILLVALSLLEVDRKSVV